jgi:predicted dithiol-disulfide oxidoreductase (DUF899 family)
VAALREWGRRRGWHALRLVSAAPSSFKSDFEAQGPEGTQHPAISVFVRADDGSVRHFYTGRAEAGDVGGGLDQLSPVWNLLDLTPDGRGDWYPRLEYDLVARS